MVQALSVTPPEEILIATAALPASKSIAARAMLMAAIAGQAPAPQGPDDECDDLRMLRRALSAPPVGNKDAGASGTAMRFLTALYAATPGADVTIDGTPRLRERPVSQLVDALRALGADIEYTAADGRLPLRMRGRQLRADSPVVVDATVSSQFISALLLVAPTLPGALELRLKGEPASMPYIDLTLDMMRRRGIAARREGADITVAPGSYSLTDADNEPDWSAAAFWYEVAALSAGWVSLPGLKPDSLQGDARARHIFERLGVLTDFTDRDDDGEPIPYGAQLSASPEVFSRLDLDLSATPDLVPALAVTCCLLGVPFSFTGLHTLRSKECDRIQALIDELDKLTFSLAAPAPGTLQWEGQRHPVAEILPLDAHGDHRIAMALAPVALHLPDITIRGAETVAKSYPAFWEQLQQAGFTITDVTPQP